MLGIPCPWTGSSPGSYDLPPHACYILHILFNIVSTNLQYGVHYILSMAPSQSFREGEVGWFLVCREPSAVLFQNHPELLEVGELKCVLLDEEPVGV